MTESNYHDQSALADHLDGVDYDDGPVHVRIAGTWRSYCGRDLKANGYIPPAEVTESSWCPDCVRIQDGEL